MSFASKIIIQGPGYDPSVGPSSTGPAATTANILSLSSSSSAAATVAIAGSTPTTPTISTQNYSSSIGTGINVNSVSTTGNGDFSGVGNNSKAIKINSSTAPSIYDRNLHRAKHEISLSSLSYLFMQIISINLNSSKSLIEVERKLNNLGYTVGLKYLELTSLRVNFNNNLTSSGKSNTSKREIKVLEILQFIVTTIWKNLFDKNADNLEKSSESANQFMIIDNEPLLSRFISVPKEYESLNCEAFISGLIEGILDSSYFKCEVSAHNVAIDNFSNRTVYLIKFDDCVVKREARLK